MANPTEIERRFKFVVVDDEQRQALEENRGHYWALADHLDETLPAGREAALAMTHLEQSHLWANAAVARPRAA